MKKKKMHPMMRILTILFFVYLGLFITAKTGYYQKNIKDKIIMTNEKIAEFESDVAQNKEVDIKSYLPDKIDYSNTFTKGANAISKKISKILTSQVSSVFTFLKALFIG